MASKKAPSVSQSRFPRKPPSGGSKKGPTPTSEPKQRQNKGSNVKQSKKP